LWPQTPKKDITNKKKYQDLSWCLSYENVR